jgi:hypothetical protein
LFNYNLIERSLVSGLVIRDAGIGAAGAVVLLSAGARSATALRRRRMHRALAG